LVARESESAKELPPVIAKEAAELSEEVAGTLTVVKDETPEEAIEEEEAKARARETSEADAPRKELAVVETAALHIVAEPIRRSYPSPARTRRQQR
jgi:hypothetical protein